MLAALDTHRPPMTVPSVQKPMVRTPLTVPAAARIPDLSRLVEQLDAALVEEGSQTQQRVTRVERLADRLGAMRSSSEPLPHQTRLKLVTPERDGDVVATESGTSCSPRTVISERGSPATTSRSTSGSRLRRLSVGDDPVAQRHHGQDRPDRRRRRPPSGRAPTFA